MEERFTWYELKKFCNELVGEQLGQDVIVWGEGLTKKITGVEIIGERSEPVSEYLSGPDTKDILDSKPIVARKGELRLYHY